jgi:hypothetical protein
LGFEFWLITLVVACQTCRMLMLPHEIYGDNLLQEVLASIGLEICLE